MIAEKRPKKACNGDTRLQKNKNVIFAPASFENFSPSKARVTVTRENGGKVGLTNYRLVSYGQKKRVTPCNLLCNPPLLGLHF